MGVVGRRHGRKVRGEWGEVEKVGGRLRVSCDIQKLCVALFYYVAAGHGRAAVSIFKGFEF